MKLLELIYINSISSWFSEYVVTQLPLSNRQKSMLFDFAYAIGLLIQLSLASVIEREVWSSDYFWKFAAFPAYILYLMNKDIANEQSLGKRKFGYRIVDERTNNPASQLQCMLRNITLVIWPVEGFIVKGTPEYRIGDYLARTKVIKANTSSDESIIPELRTTHLTIGGIVGILVVLGLTIGLMAITTSNMR